MLRSEGWREPWIPSGSRSLFCITVQHECAWCAWWPGVRQLHSSRVTFSMSFLIACQGFGFSRSYSGSLAGARSTGGGCPIS